MSPMSRMGWMSWMSRVSLNGEGAVGTDAA